MECSGDVAALSTTTASKLMLEFPTAAGPPDPAPYDTSCGPHEIRQYLAAVKQNPSIAGLTVRLHPRSIIAASDWNDLPPTALHLRTAFAGFKEGTSTDFIDECGRVVALFKKRERVAGSFSDGDSGTKNRVVFIDVGLDLQYHLRDDHEISRASSLSATIATMNHQNRLKLCRRTKAFCLITMVLAKLHVG